MWTLRHHWSRVTAGLAALIALSLLACVAADQPTDTDTGSGASSPEGDLNLTIYNSRTEERVTAQDVSEIQEQLPFSIVVPEYLPPGLRLTGMTALVGGPGKIRSETAELYFRSTDGGDGLVLNQAAFEEGIGTPGISGTDVEEIAIGDGAGQLQEVDEPERHFITMVWTGCGVAFTLAAPGQHDREELVRVAESTLACRGLE